MSIYPGLRRIDNSYVISTPYLVDLSPVRDLFMLRKKADSRRKRGAVSVVTIRRDIGGGSSRRPVERTPCGAVRRRMPLGFRRRQRRLKLRGRGDGRFAFGLTVARFDAAALKKPQGVVVRQARGRERLARTAMMVVVSLIAFAAVGRGAPASALEVFGIKFGGSSSAVPEGALAYQTTLNVNGGHDGLGDALKQRSTLVSNEKTGATDLYALLAQARNDQVQLKAALFAEGYYAGRIDIRLADRPIENVAPETVSVDGAAPVPVIVSIEAGPQFRFGTIVLDGAAQQPSDVASDVVIAARDVGLVEGEVAKSSAVVQAEDKLVEKWRANGYPFAQVADRDIVADHATQKLAVRLTVKPGPPAVYGWVNVSTSGELSREKIAQQSAVRSGEKFNPKDLQKTRDRLRKLPSVESVRITEGEMVDAGGGIPVTVDVTERKPRYIGATASLSTLDGAEVQAYWGHRNFFGEGEHLRIEGAVSRIGSDGISQLEYDAAAILTKPGVFDRDTNLFTEFRIKREHPDTYDSLSVSAKSGLTRVFTPELSGSLALAAKFTRVDDAFGESDYVLLSMPGQLSYDTRDNPLDATEGVLITGTVTPTVDVANSAGYVATEGQIATYRAIDPDRRIVAAMRVAAGSVAGASLADVPATTRFFAGGGGSVRGYEYRSLGPAIGREVIGGLSYASATAEIRARVTDKVGIVPFIDVATVSDRSWPDFSEAVYVGAGVGLRYYTALGPLRIDLAMPVTNKEGQSKFAFYVGLGQAF